MRTIQRVIALAMVMGCLTGLAFGGAVTSSPQGKAAAGTTPAMGATEAGAPGAQSAPEASNQVAPSRRTPAKDALRVSVDGNAAEIGTQNFTLDGSIPVAHPVMGSQESLLVCPSQTLVVLPNNGFFVQTARAPVSINAYERGVYLILGSELSAAGLASGSPITGIGWNYFRPPGVSNTAPLKLYLENTTDTVRNKPGDFAGSVAPMTLVHSANTALPNAAGPFDIPFAGGSPFVYSGAGLYVAFDWGQATNLATPSATNVGILVNTTQPASGFFAGANGAPPPNWLVSSANRPETRMSTTPNAPNNDVSVDIIYAHGVLPNGLTGEIVMANVTNRGSLTQTNIPVTLTVTGANAFTDTQIVASLAPCNTTTTVTFAPWTPTTNGSNTLTVSVPVDDNNTNNIKTKIVDVTANRYSYKYPGSTASGGVGNTAPIQFVAKFSVNSPTQVDTVNLEFFAVSATTYKVVLYGDNGSGTPGAQLYVDASDRTVTAAGPTAIRLPSPVAVSGIFFAGIQQTNTVNASVSFDNEVPIRAGAFYLSGVPATTWSDFAPANAFKLNLGVTLGACLVPLSVDVVPNAASACAGQSIQFTCNATGGTPPYTYQWTENGSNIGGATSSTYTATHAAAGSFTYNCKVTDNGGCTNVQDAVDASGTWLPDGSACSDGNPCTGPDTCGGGGCQPGPNPCEDNNACTVDVCDGVGGCTHPPVDCNDNNVCTADSCNTGTGCINAPINGTCTDGNPCTAGDACSGGVCVPGAFPSFVQFCDTRGNTIQDSAAPPTAASAYPATISVGGVGGYLCAMTVNLNGIAHTFPDDIDMLLARSSGPNAIIMSDVGGGSPVTGVNLTLSDAAANSIPDAGPLGSGTFKPTDVTTGSTGTETYAAPAPAPLGGSALSVFTGTNPNGPWNLWVVDDEPGDSGSISGGWCINVAAAPASCTLSSQCDDFTACTTDACTNGTCTNTAATTNVTHLKIGTSCAGGCTDKHTIVWDAVAGGTPYDIIYGYLEVLHSSGLAASTGGCLGDNINSPSSDDGDSPGPDQGFWYLARARNCIGGLGTYDEGGNQVASRDPLIPAPPTDCSRP